ncbi:MAG: helicase-related protein, partial [Armatimonadota bacterium]
EESEKLDAQAATDLAKRLQRDIMPDLRIGLIHGRMSVEEKDAVMKAFRDGRLDVLCSTTVIEVGVDVPNATVMLEENAERFGLAQLHQLRGRVGRGSELSHCVLLVGNRSSDAWERLEILARTNDGFEIAEHDLRIRGPGEFYGTRQHGLPDLKMADILADTPTLVEAREDAFVLVREDPELARPQLAALRREIARRVDERMRLVNVS